MKVLFVLTDDFPFTGACASLLNNLFFNADLSKSIEELEVLTAKHALTQVDVDVYKDVQISRYLAWRYISMQDILESWKQNPITFFKGMGNKAYNWWLRKFNSAHFLNPVVVRSVVNSLEKMDAKRFDIIVGVAGDFSVLEGVRQFVHRRGNKFVVYQVDPCSTNYTMSNASKKAREGFEILCYEQADKVITTPIICEEINTRCPKQFTDKLIAMEFPNVVPSKVVPKKQRERDHVECVFTGSIYSGIRNPDYSIHLFEELAHSNVNFRIVGFSDVNLSTKITSNNIQHIEMLGLEETKEILANADILVNIGNVMTNQVPSKLFEYISTGKPIVNICKNRDCPTLPYLSQYPMALNLFEDDDLEKQAMILEKFIQENQGKIIPKGELLCLYEKCTPVYCANQIMQEFSSIL